MLTPGHPIAQPIDVAHFEAPAVAALGLGDGFPIHQGDLQPRGEHQPIDLDLLHRQARREALGQLLGLERQQGQRQLQVALADDLGPADLAAPQHFDLIGIANDPTLLEQSPSQGPSASRQDGNAPDLLPTLLAAFLPELASALEGLAGARGGRAHNSQRERDIS